MTAVSIKESDTFKFTHYLHLSPVFLFSSFLSVSKSQKLEIPFMFNKSPARVRRRVSKRKKQHLPTSVLKALCFDNWPFYLRLNNHNATRTPTLSSHVRLQAPLESGTFQGSAASIFNVLTHPIMISNPTDFSCTVFRESVNKAP